jgi:hypothetical protein
MLELTASLSLVLYHVDHDVTPYFLRVPTSAEIHDYPQEVLRDEAELCRDDLVYTLKTELDYLSRNYCIVGLLKNRLDDKIDIICQIGVQSVRTMESKQIDALYIIFKKCACIRDEKLLLHEGYHFLIERFCHLPKPALFENIVIFVVKFYILQDDVHHRHVFPTNLHSLHQLPEELKIEIVTTDHLTDDHTSDSVQVAASLGQKQGLHLVQLGRLEVHCSFIAL